MGKMVNKIEENFFTSNVFTFESYSCHCEIEKGLNIIGEPTEIIKITADKTQPLHFAFGSKVGLVRLNADGSVAESNILGKLLAIDNSKVENYFDFFKRNGFLLPVSQKNHDTVEKSELGCIINRLHATLLLMSTITDMSRTSYEKIVRMLFYHLFSPIVHIETRDGACKYTSSKHQYTQFLENYKNAEREERLYDTFNNAEFTFTDTLGTITLNADFVDGVLNRTLINCQYENSLFREVFTTYCSPRAGKSKNMLLINDFIFRYLYEVGVVMRVDLENIYYVDEKVSKDNFTTQMKSRATEIAKFLIKEEIEANLRRVRPTYNIYKLEPTWTIDSLLSALYFGLFYMRPNMENYRRCANPKCGEFFLVPISSQKKKYCCRECMNREMAARKRARDISKATKEQ